MWDGSLPGLGSYLLTTGLALVLVIGLAAASLWLIKRFIPGSAGGRTIRIVETIALEPRRSMHLIEIGGRLLLVGSTDGGMTLIAEFDKTELPVPPPRPPAARRFADLVRLRSRG